MSRSLIVLICVVAVAWTGDLARAELVIAEGDQSAYRIVIPTNASPTHRYAAEELQHFFHRMTGATLAIVTDADEPTPKEILLGDAHQRRSIATDIDIPSLGQEGYVIRTVGQRLVIAAGPKRGILFGVYGLLDDHLGCRWFTPEVSHIPQVDRLVIDDLNERIIPALEYREPLLADNYDGDWMARNRMNGTRARFEAHHGGKVTFGRGFFVHTFNRLVPPDKYFETNPEYFSLVKGERLKDHSQLCTTNEDVIELCIQGVRKAMREQPDAFAFSVSQNDWYNYCECNRCQALAKREGSQMAPVLQLTNRVAQAIEHEFPDKVIETLAYQWTRKAPRTMRPRQNVIVRLCSIECCFSHPLETCDSKINTEYRKDVRDWAKVANRLWVWNYGTAFRHYLLPFPNQLVRDDNFRFYIDNNVRGIMEQDTHNTKDSELAKLGGYITARFLWNPHYDQNTAINEFLEGYYGPAAGIVRQYIDLIHDHVNDQNIHMIIWVKPTAKHLDDALLERANELWKEAQSLAADDSAALERVKLSRMSVDYAILERARARVKDEDGSQSAADALARERFRPFFETLERSNVTRIEEWVTLDLPAYRSGLASDLGIEP